jgi:hypothetical protein
MTAPALGPREQSADVDTQHAREQARSTCRVLTVTRRSSRKGASSRSGLCDICDFELLLFRWRGKKCTCWTVVTPFGGHHGLNHRCAFASTCLTCAARRTHWPPGCVRVRNTLAACRLAKHATARRQFQQTSDARADAQFAPLRAPQARIAVNTQAPSSKHILHRADARPPSRPHTSRHAMPASGQGGEATTRPRTRLER